MSRSSDRGLVEPVPALVAAVVVSLALSLYAGVLGDALPTPRDRETADHVADRIEHNGSNGGVVVPGRLSDALGVVPEGYTANLTLRTDDRNWTAGPTPPDSADTTTRFVSVELGPSRIRPGRLTVAVWR